MKFAIQHAPTPPINQSLIAGITITVVVAADARVFPIPLLVVLTNIAREC